MARPGFLPTLPESATRRTRTRQAEPHEVELGGVSIGEGDGEPPAAFDDDVDGVVTVLHPAIMPESGSVDGPTAYGAATAVVPDRECRAEERVMSGVMVEFPVNGTQAGGYLAVPEGGGGPGVVVLQEWWGLVPQIKGVCDRLATEGFVALAPDLYHGEMAGHTEMDRAGELMTGLPPDRAARDMSGAIDFLMAHDATTGPAVGVTGFCMGGMLTLMIAALEGDRVAAAAPFYGAPLGDDGPDWSGLTARVEGHFASDDDFFPPDAVRDLQTTLREMGGDVTFHVYEDTGHAFANEENPLGTYDEATAAIAWERTVDLLRNSL